MSYEVRDPITGAKVKKYTLKEKYEYYKKKANSNNANKANRIKRKMGANKRKYDYYSK